MTNDPGIRLVAWAGGIVFVASLAYGVWAYAWQFGAAMPVSAARDVSAVGIDVLLFTAFALHHSALARPGARQWMARVLSPRLERSAYVWVASVLFLLVMAAWQPVGGVLWDARGTPVLALLAAVQAAGVLVTARASSVLDVLSLAGIRQAEGDPTPLPPQLIRTGLYRWVRHPIYFGWVLMVWPAATMTGTRLTFAAVSTLYLAAAIPLEERALRRRFGRAYDRYATSVRWRMLPGVY